MTTIAVVRKNGYAAIAADTMTKWGTGKETAEYIINHSKILKVGNTYIGVTGSATFKTILQDYFGRSRTYARFDTPFAIFKTWHKLHAALKQEYYLVTGHSEEDVLESSRMDALIVNARGIFGVAAHRTVQEFSKFYAFGSGGDFAMVRCIPPTPRRAGPRKASRARRSRPRPNSTTAPACRWTALP